MAGEAEITDAVIDVVEAVAEAEAEKRDEITEINAAIVDAAIEREKDLALNERFATLEKGYSECLSTLTTMRAELEQTREALLETRGALQSLTLLTPALPMNDAGAGAPADPPPQAETPPQAVEPESASEPPAPPPPRARKGRLL